MDLTDAIIDAMRDDELYEVTPLTGVFPAADLPRGYAGEAYYRDDPRLAAALRELNRSGWALPAPDRTR